LCDIFTQKPVSCVEAIMLIEFSVGNYRSFKERVTLSMEAAEIASQPPLLDEHNVFAANDDLRLLTSAAIYGANASGKSNLVLAIGMMRHLVLTSSRDTQQGAIIPVEAFQLSTATDGQPSYFEIVFLAADVQYRYGFEVTQQQVIAEWLYQLGERREKTLFTRDATEILVSSRNFREGRGLEKRTRRNALFLSVVAQFNGEIAAQILQWFTMITIRPGLDEDSDLTLASRNKDDIPYRVAIEQLIRRLDTGIEAVQIETRPFVLPENVPSDVQQGLQFLLKYAETLEGTIEQTEVKTAHRQFDADGQPLGQVLFSMTQQESRGTQRLFALAGAFLRTLHDGLILLIDELDARLHPNLVIELIKLFNNPTTNPKHAQLIFTTHNTNLLNARLFRRDQIWFVEKSRQGASDLYSLVEYRVDGKIIRNDASFEKDYVAGRYGAVPFIGDLSALLGAEHEQTLQH
jgi:predicted ATPase